MSDASEVVRIEDAARHAPQASPSIIAVRRAQEGDLASLGPINVGCFSGNSNSADAAAWMRAWQEDPMFRTWVATDNGRVVGYIVWQILGGWNRKEPVIELQQLAVDESQRRNGAGYALIERTLMPVGQWVRSTNRFCGDIGKIIVWAMVDNPANRLYRKFFSEVGGFRLMFSKPENMMVGKIVIPPLS
jgi:ribosomal protein S18 acetylase RimI-like enzyme